MLMTAEVRDPRAMNHMDPETKLVHARLESWGRIIRDRPQGALPANTLLGRVIEQGPMGAGQAAIVPVSMSDMDAQTDAAVSRLWKLGQRCIRRYYTDWEPPETMARKEGMRLRHFQEVLRRSRWLVGSFLEQMEHEPVERVFKGM